MTTLNRVLLSLLCSLSLACDTGSEPKEMAYDQEAEPAPPEQVVHEEPEDSEIEADKDEKDEKAAPRMPPGILGIMDLNSQHGLGDFEMSLELAQINAADQATIRSVIKARRSRVLDCYNKALSNEPDLSGLIVVIFDIVDGMPQAIEVAGMTPGLQACVKSRIMVWRFTGVAEVQGIELTYNMQPSG